MSSVKQVIVIRKDLKMRRGKEVAQGCHASMAVILNEMYSGNICCGHGDNRPGLTLVFNDQEIQDWLSGSFTKICVIVNSEEELLDIFNKAKEAGLRTALITDSGKTEFNGVPTHTAVAIGPNYSENIDKITGHLSLY